MKNNAEIMENSSFTLRVLGALYVPYFLNSKNSKDFTKIVTSCDGQYSPPQLTIH